MSKKWTKLGSIRKRTTKAGTQQSYIVLNKEFVITNKETGEKVDLGEYRQIKLMSAKDSLNSLLNSGVIDQDKFEKQMEYIEEKNITYELTVPPVESK